ncbi:MAG: 2-oxo acid dehydrogenase subunit E2 [Lachnospiraceae bacterium]|nr:2-oxo acid dehydrogenase subunit E2 [Lachnospiraceae bacterium]
MATAVIMPKAGISVESCLIGTWKKKVGDTVRIGDVLFSYETDKANFECESTAEGELLEIFFEDGDEVPCLVNVCAVGTKGEDVSALRPAGASAPAAPAPEAEKTAPAPQTAAAAIQETAAAAGGISPRARKLAEHAGVDAAQAGGTGPGGRIIERDVRRLMEEGPARKAAPSEEVSAPAAQTAAPAAAAPAAMAAPEYEDIKFSGIRRAISTSMSASLQNAAQLSHTFSFDAGPLLAYRKVLKASEGETAGITVGDLILYAVAHSLLECPDLNAHMLDATTIRRFSHVHLGVAVDTPRGLMVPTIFNADQKSLLEISRELKALAAECRSGAINPDKLTGATFTVSNLGSFGVESFTPVINPPQTGILGVCTTQNRPRLNKDGTIGLYPAMTLSLTYDHRAIDGAPASRYMQKLCRSLENFTVLLAR